MSKVTQVQCTFTPSHSVTDQALRPAIAERNDERLRCTHVQVAAGSGAATSVVALGAGTGIGTALAAGTGAAAAVGAGVPKMVKKAGKGKAKKEEAALEKAEVRMPLRSFVLGRMSATRTHFRSMCPAFCSNTWAWRHGRCCGPDIE